MHTMWKGSISFGLVNVPIKMYAATENHDVKFRHLHGECGTPMKYSRTCPSCEREIEWSELVKGYEIEPNRFVILSDEELAELSPIKSKAISILDFVRLEEIDPIYFKKTYYLTPEDTGVKAYTLLRTAMQETGKIAVAKMVIRESESLAVIRSFDHYLVLEAIYYPDEVRQTSLLPQIPETTVEEAEMKMATLLIDSLTTEFDPAKYKDDYRERVLEAITTKAAGQELHTPHEPEPAQIADLMKALQASLDLAKQVEPEQDRQPARLRLVAGGTDAPDTQTRVKSTGTRRRRRKTAAQDDPEDRLDEAAAPAEEESTVQDKDNTPDQAGEEEQKNPVGSSE